MKKSGRRLRTFCILVSFIFGFSSSVYLIKHTEQKRPLVLGDIITNTHPQELRSYFEDLSVESEKLAGCITGRISPQEKCLERLQNNKPCAWWEEVASYLQISHKEVAYYTHLAQRPCKSKPRLMMKEFPKPICTKVSHLRTTDVQLCNSWSAIDRSTGLAQRLWYQQVGVWEIFRQTYYNSKSHRDENGKTLCQFSDSMNSKQILEYGSGIAPFSRYMTKNCPKNIEGVSIVDIPAEHFYFGLWSLRYKLDFFVGKKAKLKGYEISERKVVLPRNAFNIIIVITVFEHLPNPYDVAQMLLDSLKSGGFIYEDFCAKEPGPEEKIEVILKDVSDMNLGVARVQRGKTLSLFKGNCALVHGDYGECSKRLWKC